MNPPLAVARDREGLQCRTKVDTARTFHPFIGTRADGALVGSKPILLLYMPMKLCHEALYLALQGGVTRRDRLAGHSLPADDKRP